MIDDIICVRLPRRLGSTSGDGGGSVSTLGSVVAPSLEDSLKSSDSGVASGTFSRSGSALSRLRVPKVQVEAGRLVSRRRKLRRAKPKTEDIAR